MYFFATIHYIVFEKKVLSIKVLQEEEKEKENKRDIWRTK